jgi:tetratricopeptide (TPR) repeat protein
MLRRVDSRLSITSGLALLLGLALLGCSQSAEGDAEQPAAAPASTTAKPKPPPEAIFIDAAAETGLEFNHFNGMTGQLYLVEMMGPGVALFDYDNDGDLDVYVVQGDMFEPGTTFDDALFPPLEPLPLTDRLFRNDLQPGPEGRPLLRFSDVTRQAGLVGSGYGQGVAAGDYDNDGWVDLYVTRYGPNQFLRNNGDGTFSDVTRETSTSEDRWSVSAAFLDFDNDGWLDLYVGNYLGLTHQNHRKCFNLREDYCNPKAYNPVPDRLFRNRGDGTFEDFSVAARIAGDYGGALGIATADFNADGWLDVYVANDGMANQCWMNQGDGSFENTALLAGCALNEMGDAEAGMGVDTGDFDNDGDEDLFLAHLATETNTLYVNDGSGVFDDGTRRADLAAASLPLTGFGASWLDFDNDGLLDLMVVNGAVTIVEELALANDPYPLHQPNKLFRNLGEGRFEDWSSRAGEVFRLSEVSRGVAFGDLDNDGDTDAVIGNNSGPARLLLNQWGNANHWIGLRVVGGAPPRELYATWVGILAADGRTLWRRSGPDGSYASSSDPRLLFGLGAASEVHLVRAHWPDGSVEEWEGLPADRWSTLARGTGRPLSGRRPAVSLLAEWSGRPPALVAEVRQEPGEAGGGAVAGLGEWQPVAEGLAAVELPDLSTLETEVQQELRQLHDRLERSAGRDDRELADVYGALGMRAQAYSLRPTAKASYYNAQQLDPTAFRWPYFLAHCLLADGQTRHAAASFRRSLALRPDYVPALVRLGELSFELGAEDEADALFRRAVTLDPGCAPARVGLGRVAESRGDYAAAVEQFEQALAHQPEATSLHYNLAMIYRRLGDLERAEEHLALKGEGRARVADAALLDVYRGFDSVRVLIEQGRAAASAGRYRQAATDLLEAVRRNPEQPTAHLVLGAVMDALGRLDEAREHYQKAIDLENNPRAYYGLGLVQARGDVDEDAARSFARAVELDPSLKQARIELAKTYERLGRTEAALTAYAELLRSDPLNAVARLRSAICLVRLRRHREAVEQLERDVADFPGEPAFAHVLARLLVASPDADVRDATRAVGMLQALSQVLRDVSFGETIAMAMAEVGRFDEAVAWQRRSIDFARRAGHEELAEQMWNRLRLYEDRQPCREPWQAGDPIFLPSPAPAS